VPDPARDPATDGPGSDARVYAAGIAALVEALGQTGAARFLHLLAAHPSHGLNLGSGDYTTERAGWADRATVGLTGAV